MRPHALAVILSGAAWACPLVDPGPNDFCVAWSSASDSTPDSYEVLYGPSPGSYTVTVPVSSSDNTLALTLADGTWHIAVREVSGGVPGPESNEVAKTLPDVPLVAPGPATFALAWAFTEAPTGGPVSYVSTVADTPQSARLVPFVFVLQSDPYTPGASAYYIDERVSSSWVNTKYRDAPECVLIFEAGLADDMELASGTQIETIAAIDVVPPYGTGPASVTDYTGSEMRSLVGAAAGVVSVGTKAGRIVVGTMDRGATRMDGSASPGRRVFFGLDQPAADAMTPEGEALAEQLLSWCAG